jgi:hypothetical protein
MTEPESPTTPFGASTSEATSPEPLQRQFQSLRTLFVATLMALLLLSVGVDIYFWYQVKLVHKELDATRAFLNDYQKTKEPLLAKLLSGLQTFAQSHPDFTPILEKYGVKPAATGQASPPTLTPMPVTGNAKE